MSRKHILLVSRDRRLTALLTEMCRKWHFCLTDTTNAEQALKRIHDTRIDLVIIASNLHSYSLEEWNLARELRSRGLRTPIIAISDHGVPGDALRAYQSGIDELLVKPVDIDRLHMYIDSHLKNTGKKSFVRTPYPTKRKQHEIQL